MSVDKGMYFVHLLNEAISLGVALLSYGNLEIQEQIVNDYKESFKNYSIG